MSIDLEAAWALVGEPKKLDALYESSDDPDVKEARDRVENTRNEPEAVRVLLEEGCTLGGPLAVSKMFDDDRRWSAAALMAGVDVGRPIQPWLEGVEVGWQLPVLASSPHESDRTWAIDAYEDDPETRAGFASRLVSAGDARGERRLLECLEAWVTHHEQTTERIFGDAPDTDVDAPTTMLMALIARPVPGAAPLLARMLRTDYAPMTLVALGQQDDSSVVETVERYRTSLAGDRNVTAALREGAANVLRRAGKTVPLDDARYLRDELLRERYGYPSWDDMVIAHRIAAEAFLMQGDERDRAWVATLATAPAHMLRVVGRQAASHATCAWWDTARAKRVMHERGTDALFDALDDPAAVFTYKIVEVLAETAAQDDGVRRRLTAWCRALFERIPNFYISESYETPDEHKAAMSFLTDLDDAQRAVGLDGTTSVWLQTFVLNDGEMKRPEPVRREVEGAEVAAFDLTPWTIGLNVNGLAVSPDGSRIAVVGENHCRQLDASTGLTAVHQELRWNWGYDVAYSPDGTKLAACFHGGHVEIYEAQSGERIAELSGHGGVPHGVRCLAWSADGSTLVTGGSDAQLIAWDVASHAERWRHSGGPGSYQDVVLLPDGRVLAAHCGTAKGEKDFVELIDLSTGKVIQTFARKKSVWSIAVREDGLLALGGEDKKIVLSKDPLKKKLKTWRKLDQAQVTRLEFVGNTLYATGQDGFVMAWDTDTMEDAALVGEGASVWALATHGERAFAAGKAGRVHVIEGRALQPSAGASHARRVVAIDVVPSGVVTADWDGKLIQWPHEGGIGREVIDLDLTIESSAKVDDDTILYGTRKGLYLLRVSDGQVVASTEVRADEVAIDGEVIGAYHRSDLAFYALPSLTTRGEPVCVGTDTINSVAAAPGGGFVTGNEDGQAVFVRDGERVWVKKDHGADRLRLGDPHCNIASIAFAPDGTRFATAATDHVVRVYTWPDAELQLRIACGFGLFNRIDFSPDGALLAVPSSWLLQVFDARTGEETHALGAVDHFDANELAGARFIGERELLVGCDTGRIFRVQL